MIQFKYNVASDYWMFLANDELVNRYALFYTVLKKKQLAKGLLFSAQLIFVSIDFIMNKYNRLFQIKKITKKHNIDIINVS